MSLWVPALICGFCMQNSVFRTRITSLSGSQTPPMVLGIQNGDFSTRIASLWVSALICGFCIQNSDFSTRIASVYGSQPSSVVLCIQNSVFGIRNTSLYGSKPSFVAFACKTATLGPDLQVSKSPSPHLWFLHAKQRLLDQNYKSLWVPEFAC